MNRQITANIIQKFIEEALPAGWNLQYAVPGDAKVDCFYFDVVDDREQRCYVDYLEGKIRINLRPDFSKGEQDLIFLDLVDPESQNKLRSLLKELMEERLLS